MSEKTEKIQLTPEQNEKRKLVVHFPRFVQAEGIAMHHENVGSTVVERGGFASIGVGDRVRIGDCTVKCMGLASDGNIHVDLYPDSQSCVQA